LAVLNELSLPARYGLLDEGVALALMEGLADSLRVARIIRSDLSLVSPVSIISYPVTRVGGTLGSVALRRGGRARDQWLSVQRALSRAPFQSIPGHPRVQGDEEYRHEEETAIGLGFAHARGQLAVSLRGERWNRLAIALVRHRVEQVGSDIVGHHENVTVRHAMTAAHVREHTQDLREASLPDSFSGADLWADRAVLYPCLAFLPAVEGHLAAVSCAGAGLTQVHEKLKSLDDACAKWAENATVPDWQTNVTPENEQRRQLCMFEDLDGTRRCFDWHARFTPEPGRIYFRVTARTEAQRAIIAYIGHKLGA
jgi:hypothetical protein